MSQGGTIEEWREDDRRIADAEARRRELVPALDLIHDVICQRRSLPGAKWEITEAHVNALMRAYDIIDRQAGRPGRTKP